MDPTEPSTLAHQDVEAHYARIRELEEELAREPHREKEIRAQLYREELALMQASSPEHAWRLAELAAQQASDLSDDEEPTAEAQAPSA